jgi:phosphoglucomutase
MKYFLGPKQIYSYFIRRKKIASVGAANQVFIVVAKHNGTAPTASASRKLAARTVTQIKVLVCLNHCISLCVFFYEI